MIDKADPLYRICEKPMNSHVRVRVEDNGAGKQLVTITDGDVLMSFSPAQLDSIVLIVADAMKFMRD